VVYTIEPGHYEYPFTISLPDRELPPSYENGPNFIRYELEARTSPHWTSSIRSCVPVIVIPTMDCNSLDRGHEGREEKEKTVCCCCFRDRGSVSLTVRTPSTFWCPGEVVPVAVKIENHSTSFLDDVSCRLIASNRLSYRSKQRFFIREYPVLKLNQMIPPKSERSNVFLYRIPPCCPHFSFIRFVHGDVFSITVDYKLRVTVHHPVFGLNVWLNVGIGTVPHRSSPVFSEQMSGPQQSQSVSYPWANPKCVSEAATALLQSSQSTSWEDPPPADDLKCVYFDMPPPSIPSVLTPGGREQTPLISSSSAAPTPGSFDHSATTTTTISSDDKSSSPSAPVVPISFRRDTTDGFRYQVPNL